MTSLAGQDVFRRQSESVGATPTNSSRAADPLGERLRTALAQQASARAELIAAQKDIDEIIDQMRGQRRSWRSIAANVPLAERSREARRLCTRAYRRRVTSGDGIRRAGEDEIGTEKAERSPSSKNPNKEKVPMNTPRLIKRRTVTTEELFDDGPCAAPGIEHVDTSAEHPRGVHGEGHEQSAMKGAESAGIDDPDFEGDED